MSVIANLKVMLGADSSELTTAFKKTDKSSKKWAKAQQRRNKLAAESFKRVAMGVAAVGTALASTSVIAVKYADQLAKQSRTLGITVEQLQEYTFAAERSGVSTEEMVKGLQQFNKFVGQAARGTGTAKVAFEDMGISLTDMKGNLRPSNVLIDEFVEKMSGIESPAMRAGLAADVFGRAGVKLLPMMGQGKEGLDALKKAAHEMGNVMANETAAKAEVLNDKLDTFTTALKTKFYSALVEGTDKYLPAIIKTMDILEGVIGIVTGSVKGLISMFHMYRAGIYTLIATNTKFARSIWQGLAKAVSLVPLYFKKLSTYYELGIANTVSAAAKAAEKALSSAPYFIQSLFGYTKGSLSTGADAMVVRAQSQIDAVGVAIQKAKDVVGKETVLEVALFKSADKAMAQATEYAESGSKAIFDGVANIIGDKTGTAGKVSVGVDVLSDPANTIAAETGNPTEKLMGHWEKFQADLKVQQIEMATSFGSSWKDIAASYAGNLDKMGAAGKAFAVGQIAWNTSQAIMTAMSDASTPNFYMRLANAGIAGMMGAQQLSAVQGQFHSGIDSVPSTGTYLLEKGERVVDSRLNGDLKDALSNGGGMGQGGTQNITFAVTGVEDPDVINKVIQQNRGDFESMLRQINFDRAGQGLL